MPVPSGLIVASGTPVY